MQENYFIVIPGPVRADTRLSPFAKLLYGEIATKCNVRGYAWATNQFFADIFNCSIRTVQSYIKELETCGHIIVQVIKNEQGTDRRIFLTMAIPGGMQDNAYRGVRDVAHGGAHDPAYPYDGSVMPGSAAPFTHNNISNKKKNTNTIVSTPKGAETKAASDPVENPTQTMPPHSAPPPPKDAQKKKAGKTTKKKEEGQEEAENEPDLFRSFVAIYDKWFKDRNDNVPPKYDGAGGNATKQLIRYFKTIVTARAKAQNETLTDAQIMERVLSGWQAVLSSWEMVDKFLQSKTRLIDINSNIQNIIDNVKNGHAKSNQQNGGKINRTQFDQSVANLHSRFEKQ